MGEFLDPGRTIWTRMYFGSALCQVIPVRVVRHDTAGLVTWTAPGTPVLRRQDRAGRPLRDVPRVDWPNTLKPDTWFGAGIVVLSPPDSGHAVWWFSDDDTSRFAGWYVNLERHAIWVDGDLAGIDVVDQELDGWVTPDRTWRWKDEESFAAKTGDPAFWSAAEAAMVRAEGERMRSLAEAGVAPFDGTWCDFQPDPAWAPPAPPAAGWDRPPVLPLAGSGSAGTGPLAAR